MPGGRAGRRGGRGLVEIHDRIHDRIGRIVVARRGRRRVDGERGRRAEARFQHLVQLELPADLRRILGKTLEVLFRRWGFTQFFAEEEFAVDDIEGGLAADEGGDDLQMRLGQHPLADLPALPLIDGEDGDDVGGLEFARVAKEGADIGLLAGTPEVAEADRRLIEGGGRIVPRLASAIADLVESKFLGDASDGAGKLLAPSFGRAAHRSRRPRPTRGPGRAGPRSFALPR